MRKILIITTYKKIFAGLILLILAGILAYLLFIDFSPWKSIRVSKVFESDEVEELITENNRLKEILKTILPDGKEILYENPYRLYGDQTITVKTTSLQKVIEKGMNIQFSVSYKIPEYLRPIYDPIWPMAYYRGWIDLESKVEEARHGLFVFPLGASSSYDFTGSLGFEGNPKVDAHRNINFLIYHFEVEKVKQLGHQIALVGRPRRTGVEVIAVNKDDLFSQNEGIGDFLIQLSTPTGHEIDFIYEKNVMKYEYFKKWIEEHSVKSKPSFLNMEEDMTLEELQKENKLLKEELSNYVPSKICENLHTVFSMPSNYDKQSELLGKLGFIEKYSTIHKNASSLLIYNFNVDKIIKFNNQLVITGIPSRTGAEIISIDHDLLLNKKNYLVQLATPDCIEVDYDILTVE